jgi:hypothetical protein
MANTHEGGSRQSAPDAICENVRLAEPLTLQGNDIVTVFFPLWFTTRSVSHDTNTKARRP